MLIPGERALTDDEIETFLRDGVLVVDNVLSDDEATRALAALETSLARLGVHSLSVDDEESARAFSNLSSTNGSGGVLDIFYEPWKLDIATNEKLFSITQQLWSVAFCNQGESRENLEPEESHRWHPFGEFSCSRGYLYMDRIGYRLPSQLAQNIGDRVHPERKKRARSLQRSLTPHLDCCPNALYTNCSKWRPIQCFVSLTDNVDENTGGFEAALGFHREFEKWAKDRPASVVRQKDGSGNVIESFIEAPCIGQYTHIRPNEDREVMDRVRHVVVRKGSAVFWDNRIPHANAYRHEGKSPRAVVYCSFLPDIDINREYVKRQLADFRAGKPPRDQWNNIDDNRVYDNGYLKDYKFTPLGQRLMGMESWDGN